MDGAALGERSRRISAEMLGFTCIAVLQIWLVLNHSPWFDEEHALLIARAPFSDLLSNLKYEGHPALWYVWLGLWDRAFGGSPVALPGALGPVILGLQALIWFRSPFPLAMKVLLSLSYFIVFEYGAISRSYALGALLLLGAVPLRQTLLGWACLALAANTSAHDLVASIGLGAVFFWEKRDWRGPVVLLAGVGAAIFTVLPVASDLVPTSGAPHTDPMYKVLRSSMGLASVLIPSVPTWPYLWTTPLGAIASMPVTLLALALGAWTLRRSVPLTLGYLFVFLSLFALGNYTYELFLRHVGVIFIYLIAGWWMLAEQGKVSRAVWGWLAVSVACAIPFVAGTFTDRPFTHHREIANWIIDNGLARETWGAWPGREGATISAWLGHPTVNLEKDCRNTFVRWDYQHERIQDPVAHIKRDNVQYVISESPLSGGKELASFGKGGGMEWPVRLYEFPVTDGPIEKTCR